jgi:thymidylate synthase (FAD)
MPPFESPFANVTKLVWITPDAEQIIEHCARVSNPKAQDKVDTTGKLLRYLVTHKHWSPFEMASACVEITTTRDISAQILRHRSFSFQEFSQRYASTVMDLVDWRYHISVGKTKRIVNQATTT